MGGDSQNLDANRAHAKVEPSANGKVPISSVGPSDDGHELRDLPALVALVPASDRMFDAMGDVVLKDLLLDAPQRGADRGDLRHDVDAVAVLVDHLGEAADLAFDPAKAFFAGCLDVVPHAH